MVLALCALAGSSYAATKRRHTTKHAVKHSSTHAVKTSATKRGTRSKVKSRRTTRHTTHAYQAAPSPDRYKQIQQALADKGYFKGDVNGQWGTDSTEALRRFQSDQNLEPDGKLGSLSLIALGLGPKRITAQAGPEAQTAAPNQAGPPPQSKQ